MGVSGLWKLLEANGVLKTSTGAAEGDYAAICRDLDGKALAVDLSAWLMQAMQQQVLREAYASEEQACLKVVFERSINLLRHGVLPVFVLEGSSPALKQELQKRRQLMHHGQVLSSQGNRAGSYLDRLGQRVRQLAEALGLPTVQAQGEAEALCAALNALGLVDGVASPDVDSLLFGAVRVYKQLRLQVANPRACEMQALDLGDLRRLLGLQSGGRLALLAAAVLAGGDYNADGARNVGAASALRVVAHLLQGEQDDGQVLVRLARALAAEPPAGLASLTCCTGCKTCKHSSGKKSSCKQHPKTKGCSECGTSSGCAPREGSCECAFCISEPQRQLARVLARAKATEGFSSAFLDAMQCWEQQYELAHAQAQQLRAAGARFSWAHRPDELAIVELCQRAGLWTRDDVHRKLLPLMIEWDVRQGPAACWPRVCFRPSAAKPSSTGSAGGEALRYLLQVEYLPAAAAQLGEEQAAADSEALRKEAHLKHVRASVLRGAWPQLLQALAEQAATKAEKQRRQAERAAAGGGRRKKAEVKDSQQRSISSFLTKSDATATATATQGRQQQQQTDLSQRSTAGMLGGPTPSRAAQPLPPPDDSSDGDEQLEVQRCSQLEPQPAAGARGATAAWQEVQDASSHAPLPGTQRGPQALAPAGASQAGAPDPAAQRASPAAAAAAAAGRPPPAGCSSSCQAAGLPGAQQPLLSPGGGPSGGSSTFQPLFQQLRAGGQLGQQHERQELAGDPAAAGSMQPPTASKLRGASAGHSTGSRNGRQQQQQNASAGGIERFLQRSSWGTGAGAASSCGAAVSQASAPGIAPTAAAGATAAAAAAAADSDDEVSAYMLYGTPSKRVKTPDKPALTEEEEQRLRVANSSADCSPAVPLQQHHRSPLRRSLFQSAASIAAADGAAQQQQQGGEQDDEELPAWMLDYLQRKRQQEQEQHTQQPEDPEEGGEQQQQQQQPSRACPIVVDLVTPSSAKAVGSARGSSQPGSPECIDLTNC